MAISLDQSNKFLESEGYEFIGQFPGSCFVHLAKKGDQLYTIKREWENTSVFQVSKENKIYDTFGQLEGFPKKIKYYSEIPSEFHDSKTSKRMANERILVKEYIPGEHYYGGEFMSGEDKKIGNLVKYFHKQGYVYLAILPRNIILDPSKRLFLVDFGTFRTKGESVGGSLTDEETFKEYKFWDLAHLRKLFN